MRTAARETAFQIALRNCSKEVAVGGKTSIYMWFWWRGNTCNQAHIFAEVLIRVTASQEEQTSPWRNLVLFWIGEDARIGLIKSAPENILTIWRPVLPVFLRAPGASFLISTLNSFQGVLKVSSCSGTWFNPCRGRWQVPICSWQFHKCFKFKMPQLELILPPQTAISSYSSSVLFINVMYHSPPQNTWEGPWPSPPPTAPDLP